MKSEADIMIERHECLLKWMGVLEESLERVCADFGRLLEENEILKDRLKEA